MTSTLHLKAYIEDLNFFAEKSLSANPYKRALAKRSFLRAFNAFHNSPTVENSHKALAMLRYGDKYLRELIQKNNKNQINKIVRDKLESQLKWSDILQESAGEPSGEYLVSSFREGDIFFWDSIKGDPILEAIKAKNVEALEVLLKRGVVHKYPYLHHLASIPNADPAQHAIFEILLRNGANPFWQFPYQDNNPIHHNNTALHIAMRHGNKTIFKLIIDYGNQLILEGKLTREKFVELLNLEDSAGNSALHYAISEDDKEFALSLVHNGAKADKFVMSHVVLGEDLELFRLVLKSALKDDSLIYDLDGVSIGQFAILCPDALEKLKILAELEVSLNPSGKNFSECLNLAVVKEKYDVVQFILESGVPADFVKTRGALPMHSALLTGNLNIIKLLLQFNSNPLIEDDNGFNTYELLARSDGGVKLLEELGVFKSQEELEIFIKASRVRAALGMSYSANGFGFTSEFAEYHFLAGQLSEIEFPKKDLFLLVLKSFEEKKTITTATGHSKIFTLPYKGHASFAIVDFEGDSPVAKRISFCDGNFSREKWSLGFGEVSFDIDKSKLAANPDLDKFLGSLKDCYSGQSFDENKFFAEVAKIAICDADGKPIICEKSVPCKAQNRGNCGFKSMDILFRSMLRRDNPELNFAKGEDGDVIYQSYKKQLIGKNIEEILSLARSSANHPYYPKILESLQDVFLKAASKGELHLIEQIMPIFDLEKIDVSKIKNKKGENALFLALRKEGDSAKKIEIITWLLSNGVVLDPTLDMKGIDNFFASSLRDNIEIETDILKLLLSSGQLGENILVDKKELSLIALAVIYNNTDMVKFMIDLGFNINIPEVKLVKDNIRSIELLINHGFDINIAGSLGCRFLESAIIELKDCSEDEEESKTLTSFCETLIKNPKLNLDITHHGHSIEDFAKFFKQDHIAEMISLERQTRSCAVSSDFKPKSSDKLSGAPVKGSGSFHKP